MMWTEPQPNLTVFLFWPQEQSASAPTSGIWPATALFLFSTCAGNTWPRSCALWVTSTRWPAFHFVMSCLLWSRMSISTGVGFHTDSTSQENIRVHLCATCLSLYQWGWLFIPPPPEQKMNHELRWQDARSTGCEQFPKELKHCLTCKWKLNANNFRLHSTETEERQHVKSYLEKCSLLFNLMPATHSRKLQLWTHFPLQILVFSSSLI